MAKPEGPQVPLIPEGAPDPPSPQAPTAYPGPLAPHIPQVPQALQQLILYILPLNWSHFKPEFSRKPDKDAKAHLFRTNNSMDAHRFQDNDKFQRFHLTLTGEARLWYKSLSPINADWIGWQNSFRQQYLKIGNSREQLFHTWRSFHFNENTQTIDTYVQCTKQVTTLLGYQELQILEVLKNTLPQDYTGFSS